MKDIYPCTIVADRYDGTYSGGKFTAWPCDYYNLPEELGGGDPDEMSLFSSDTLLYGKGNTPQEAYENLRIKMTVIEVEAIENRIGVKNIHLAIETYLHTDEEKPF